MDRWDWCKSIILGVTGGIPGRGKERGEKVGVMGEEFFAKAKESLLIIGLVRKSGVDSQGKEIVGGESLIIGGVGGAQRDFKGSFLYPFKATFLANAKTRRPRGRRICQFGQDKGFV